MLEFVKNVGDFILDVLDFYFLIGSKPFKNEAFQVICIMMEWIQWRVDMKNIAETECM